MRKELVRDEAKSFPALENPEAIGDLTVWFCKYRTLSPISQFTSLRILKIAGVPDAKLDFLREMHQLEWLSITHLSKVENLEPVRNLRQLKWLELATLPSWDISRKRQIISSLEPIATLPGLLHISLLGVLSSDGSLQVLHECKQLQSAKFVGYSADEVERFLGATGARVESIPPATEV